MPYKQFDLQSDPSLCRCFAALPVYLQECFMQGGTLHRTAEELQRCAEHLMK